MYWTSTAFKGPYLPFEGIPFMIIIRTTDLEVELVQSSPYILPFIPIPFIEYVDRIVVPSGEKRREKLLETNTLLAFFPTPLSSD